jgi:hypothetical protein
LKFLLDEKEKFSFTSMLEPSLVTIEKITSQKAKLLMNARVQTEPEKLSLIISSAIDETMLRTGCKIIVSSVAAFQPGYPRPTHRMI